MIAAPRFFNKKKNSKATRGTKKQPMEIINRIKQAFEDSGMESYFIGKKNEEMLARVYFPSVN